MLCVCVVVVDLYTCDIHFNTVRLIAVFIICLGFLMLLLPEDWDQCLIELGTKLRKREQPVEPPETGGGLNWTRRPRTSMSTFSHWHTLVSFKRLDGVWNRSIPSSTVNKVWYQLKKRETQAGQLLTLMWLMPTISSLDRMKLGNCYPKNRL